ncbi:hypothetical protein ACFSUD_08670 [Sulfitobacter aestuarii]|uniref:Chaperone modulatory protein CbpM n=1 Tax=Sulfitobacter aestuarii TaxID=2161676 RepID=A0ABW5U1F5_9RHOB
MRPLQLTKTDMRQGIWQGILTPAGDSAPDLDIRHGERRLENFTLEHNEAAGHWLLSIPIPPEAIADGVQTLLILNREDNAQLGHVTLIAEEALADDIRAELDLLRAELDMLKRAFRRHCLETT